MIECPTCKISFSPRCRVCPRCQAFEPTLSERIEYLTSAAELALEDGATHTDVESMLVQEGISSHEAHEIVQERLVKVKGITRSYGWKRLLAGSGILILAAFPLVAGILSRHWRLGALGLILSAIGIRLVILGTRNLVAGRE